MPTSSNKPQKKGEDGMGRRWQKADCVKQVRMRDLRVRELLVRRLYVSKLCVRKCVSCVEMVDD